MLGVVGCSVKEIQRVSSSENAIRGFVFRDVLSIARIRYVQISEHIVLNIQMIFITEINDN